MALTHGGKTLNGVDETIARRMIDTFCKHYKTDTSSKSMSVWLDTNQLYNIDTLLQSEIATKNTNGIRFYFVYDTLANGQRTNKVIPLIISTKIRTPSDPTKSIYQDYYDHTASFLNTMLGHPFENNADSALQQGASLYDSKPPVKDVCNTPSVHYLPDSVAYTWVQRHRDNGQTNQSTPLNTRSEVFPLCFFHNLVQAIRKQKLSGLRIYLARGYIQSIDPGLMRDVVVLEPTQPSNNVDYYKCLEDFYPFCTSDTTKIRPGEHPFGGYDNGEMCPNSCN